MSAMSAESIYSRLWMARHKMGLRPGEYSQYLRIIATELELPETMITSLAYGRPIGLEDGDPGGLYQLSDKKAARRAVRDHVV